MLRRRTNTLFCMTVGLCLLLSGAMPAFSASTLPFTDDFETYADGEKLNNVGNWFTTANPSATVVVATSYSGSKHCYIPLDATLTNLVNGAGVARVWTDMFVKVAKRATSPVADPNLTAVFYFNTNGFPVACDGVTNNWVVYTNSAASVPLVPVDTGAWTRITVVHKYAEKKWALFVNNVLVRDSIGFLNTSASQYEYLSISNKTYLDSIRVAATPPDGTLLTSNTTLTGDVDVDGMPDYWEIDYFNNVSSQGPGDDYDGDGRSSVSEFSRNTDPTNANSFALNLPYRDGFESAATGTVASAVFRGMTNAGTVVVTASAVEGSRALGVAAGRINVPIADQYATNVWVQIYAKPTLVAGTPPDPSASQVVGFCVTTSTVNNLKVFSGAAWASPDIISNVPPNTWLGFAAHLDYGANKWQLYVSTNGLFAEHMKRVSTTALDFNTASAATSSNMVHITITNRSVSDYSYVDVLAATPAYTRPTVGTHSNVVAADRLAGTANPAVMPPYVYPAESDNTLTGAIGNDFEIGLVDTDKLQIFYTNGWNVYNLNASTWVKDGASSMNPGDLHLQPSMGMVVKRGQTTGGVDTVVFYPFDLMPTNSTTNLTIYGIANTTYRGWNLLASPFTDTRIASGATPTTGFGFQPTNYGDRIYFPDRMLYWSPTGWREGSRNSTYRMVPGEQFWYYHKGTGMVWNVAY